MAGATVGHHVAYGEYLRNGRPSIDLAPTLAWDACLIFSGILTASVPVLIRVLAELGTAHLLTTSHSRSGQESSHQSSTLESGETVKGEAGVMGGTVGRSASKSAVEGGDDEIRADNFGAASVRTMPHYGRRESQDSDALILPR